jgi:hypothetical protein
MWVLVMLVCNAGCHIMQIPGFYTDKSVCEQAVKTYSNEGESFRLYYRAAYCIPAPDDIAYE